MQLLVISDDLHSGYGMGQPNLWNSLYAFLTPLLRMFSTRSSDTICMRLYFSPNIPSLQLASVQ